MVVFFIIGFVLVLSYAYFMLILNSKFLKTISQKQNEIINQPISYSILIPARNEEKNIKNLLLNLQQQLPIDVFVEVILLNDGSTDDTFLIAEQFDLSNFNNKICHTLAGTLSGKKAAINCGIGLAKGAYIITLDADVSINKNWLAVIHNFIIQKQHIKAIALPVLMQGQINNALSKFQAIDFLTMQGITEVAVNNNWFAMCNGANFLYHKESFLAVNGFSGNQDIPSGDDMFLMQKLMDKYKTGIYYFANYFAIATTNTEPTWSSFLQQRIRWASKAKAFTNGLVKWVLLEVYILNVWLLCGVFVCVLNFSWFSFFTVFVFFMVKLLAEFMFVSKVSSFFKTKINFLSFTLLQPLHILYIAASASFGFIGNYKWKGRNIK